MTLNQIQRKSFSRRQPKKDLPLWKRIVPHILLVIGLVIYIAVGAYVFKWLEKNSDFVFKPGNCYKQLSKEDFEELIQFSRSKMNSYESGEMEKKVQDLLDNLKSKKDGEIKETMYKWDNIWAALLFAFTAVSTIGYGHIYPTTMEGRMFCVVYTLIGIPLFMITVADIGKFLWEGFAKLVDIIRDRHGAKQNDLSHAGDLPLLLSVPLLILAFAIYIICGAALLPNWEDIEFTQAAYFAFISVTTIGFGDIVPENAAYLIPTLMYIFFGLALTTLAIEVLAAAFRRVHYLGSRMAESSKAKVWLGDKLLTLNDLVRSIGREMGATEEDMKRIGEQLDIVLEEAATEREATGMIKLGSSRRMSASGEYDNLPETWANLKIPFVDDEIRRSSAALISYTCDTINIGNYV